MRKVLRIFGTLLMAFAIMMSSFATVVQADEWSEEYWEGHVRPSEPIQVEMDAKGDLIELAPGDSRDISFGPIVTGENGREFHYRGFITLRGKDGFEDYELYNSDDIEYSKTYGYEVLNDAEPLELIDEYKEEDEGAVWHVKKYAISEGKDIIEGKTPIEGLDYTVTVPHEARRLVDIDIHAVIQVRYSAEEQEVEVPEERPEVPEDKPAETPEDKPVNKEDKPSGQIHDTDSDPVDTGDNQAALGISIGLLALVAIAFILRNRSKE